MPESPGILAFWHGQMLPVWKYFSGKKSKAVVSQSRDGELLSELLTRWNYTFIRGSSSKGSKEALSEIVESAKENLILLTPDGPRGTIYEFKPGAVVAAQRAGVNLYLCKVKISKKINFNKSWDKFSLPLPLTKINFDFKCMGIIPSESSRDEVDEIIKKCAEFLNS
jgi:hypothetical protein